MYNVSWVRGHHRSKVGFINLLLLLNRPAESGLQEKKSVKQKIDLVWPHRCGSLVHQHGRQEARDVTDTPLASGLYLKYRTPF